MTPPCLFTSAARNISSGITGFLRQGTLCSCAFTRRHMTTRRQTDHLERTASNYRQMSIFPARVSGISMESDSVRRLQLEVKGFTFKAGQWVDFFIPGLEKVGGFSMCSAPSLLQREGVIELAVKYTPHPPAHWVHTKCAVDSKVAVRVGGDFYYDPAPGDAPVDLLLVAGGVGINPLYSILLHAADLLRSSHTPGNRLPSPGHTHLLYSAKSTQELLFKSTIMEMCREFPGKISCSFNVTRQTEDIDQELQPYSRYGRISQEQLRPLVTERTLCYMCGPPPMVENASDMLVAAGLSDDRIRYEKWW
ncbi:oxidoreductase NAD-binding domain-containing protein 1 [Engraulis encrasicolus]|uniref:oxidoreductase NAD-binding domain-containing protein 1 n=1 Tax=Engraulis encrasicolus TaxID=184585 RepID=UPI002FD39877